MAVPRERMRPARTTSHPVLPLLVQKSAKQLVRQQVSLDSVLSPEYTPSYVTAVARDGSGEGVSWKVYVTEVNGVRTLDLFCEESCDSQTRQTRRQLPLTELPLEVCEQVHLQRLWANHNLLSSLPPNLPRLRHLQELLLHQNKFTEFPLVVCSLSCLQMLWLSFNQIPCIPDDISNLSSLRRLHLDHNQLTELPDALCDLPHLQVLYLNHNSLTRVSEFIGKLTSLRHLLLQHNLIGTLPRGMTELSAVERLDLRHNCLRHLSMDFTFFQSEMNNNGKRVLTEGNPFDKSLVRMRSADQTSPVLRPRTMSFPISGQTRRKSDSTHSPSPSSPTTARRHKRHHLFVHSFSEEQS